jgi:ribosomal protein L25, Ctc-form
MNQFEISAEPRTDKGKGASRRLRRMGKVPGILYGASQEAVPIMMDHDDLAHHLERESFYSHILTLNIGSESQRVVLKDLQRHPVKPSLLHIDLQRVSENEKLTMRIPIHFLNEDKCVGVKLGGGVVSHIMTEIEVQCLPRHLPEYFGIDLAEVPLGTTIHLGELKMPEGVESYVIVHGGDPFTPVVSVHIPKLIVEEAPVVEVAPGEVPAEAVAAAAPEAAAKEGKETKDVKEGKETKGKETKSKETKSKDTSKGKGEAS